MHFVFSCSSLQISLSVPPCEHHGGLQCPASDWGSTEDQQTVSLSDRLGAKHWMTSDECHRDKIKGVRYWLFTSQPPLETKWLSDGFILAPIVTISVRIYGAATFSILEMRVIWEFPRCIYPNVWNVGIYSTREKNCIKELLYSSQ